jgi:hypothetical protein
MHAGVIGLVVGGSRATHQSPGFEMVRPIRPEVRTGRQWIADAVGYSYCVDGIGSPAS